MSGIDWGDEEETERTTVYEKDGRSFKITSVDPYGFCQITLAKGSTQAPW